MIHLGAEIEVVEDSKVEAEAGEDNLSTKLTLSAIDIINLDIFFNECPSWEKAANYMELDEEDDMLLKSYVELNNSTREGMVFRLQL